MRGIFYTKEDEDTEKAEEVEKEDSTPLDQPTS